MGKRIDLTGQKFGRLIVVEYLGKSKWLCKCNCGNEKVVRSDSLRDGATSSCGCYQKEKCREQREDLIGQRFGRLVVISYNEEISKQKEGVHWNCKCDCGNETVVWSSHLKCGNTISCGCYRECEMRRIVEKQWQDEGYRQMQSELCSKMSKERWQDEEMKWRMGYKGGITPIRKYLRGLPVVEQWLSDNKKQVNYTCELTGKVGGSLHTHHLKAFSTIVKEAHELHNIQVKPQVKDYTEEELHKLEEYVASWHMDNSNAVVLCKEAHDLFHKAKNKGGYGHSNNTPEQYEEFKQRYLNGEFEGLI